jgi:hypothetical protein
MFTTQFTCFTGTTVLILTYLEAQHNRFLRSCGILTTHFTCSTGTTVQILTYLKATASCGAAVGREEASGLVRAHRGLVSANRGLVSATSRRKERAPIRYC